MGRQLGFMLYLGSNLCNARGMGMYILCGDPHFDGNQCSWTIRYNKYRCLMSCMLTYKKSDILLGMNLIEGQ